MCVSVISLIQKQIAAESTNLAFYICITSRCYLKLLWRSDKNSVHRATQKNSNRLRSMDGCSCKWIFVYFDCAECNKIHIDFCHRQKHVNYRIWNELHAWLINRRTQNNLDVWTMKARNCRSFISCYFMQILNNLNLKHTMRYIRIHMQCTG